MRSILFAFILFATLTSCKDQQTISSKDQLIVGKNVFGESTRKKWDDWPTIPNPLDRMGTLKHPSGHRCTASYIGENFLITAAHCVMQKGKNRLQKGDYLFEHIQLPNGKYWDSRKITKFHFIELWQLEDGGLEAAKNHWVILEMNKDLDSPDRYFGYTYPGDDDYTEYHDSNYDLSIAGYSPEFNDKSRQLTFTEDNCEIKEHLLEGNVALHNCDAGPRDSGAAIYKCNSGEYGDWKDCHISALHIAAFSSRGFDEFPSYSRENANIAVTMKSFKGTWNYLRGNGKRPSNLKSIDNNY